MKHIILLAIGLLFYPVYGQENDEDFFSSKNELSIVVDDIFAKNVYLYSISPYYYAIDYSYYVSSDIYYLPPYNDILPEDFQLPKIGIGYKYHFDHSAIRSKIAFGTKKETIKNRYDRNTQEYDLKTFNLSAGYEFHKNMNRVQLFYGAELFIDYKKYNSVSISFYDNITYEYKTNFELTSYGISPLVGVNYFFSSSLSLSTELKFSIESYKGESTSSYTGDTVSETNKISGFDTSFGPLGQISVNIHF